MTETRAISLTVNGEPRRATVDMRTTQGDCLRDTFRLTGAHVGCEHGVCGAGTVRFCRCSSSTCSYVRTAYLT